MPMKIVHWSLSGWKLPMGIVYWILDPTNRGYALVLYLSLLFLFWPHYRDKYGRSLGYWDIYILIRFEFMIIYAYEYWKYLIYLSNHEIYFYVYSWYYFRTSCVMIISKVSNWDIHYLLGYQAYYLSFLFFRFRFLIMDVGTALRVS